MLSLGASVVFITALLTIVGAKSPLQDAPECNDLPSCGDTIQKDFVIVGGGASGVYTAVRLKEMGYSFTLVEAKDKLGGNAEEYIDPATGEFIDIGVVVFPNTTEVREFYGHFDIPLKLLVFSETDTQLYDFRTGKQFIPPVPAPTTEQLTTAFTNYATQLLKYTSLQNGWDIPDPVPEDLVTPFGEVAAKYNFSDAVPTIYLITQGAGAILDNPSLYPFNLFDLNNLLSIQSGYLQPDNASTHLIYEKALAELGSDVFLNSTVQTAKRPANGSTSDVTSINIKTQKCYQQIDAKRLIITIKPLPEILSNFDLDHHETDIFSQFLPGGYYTAVVKNSGLNETVSYQNVNVSNPLFLSPIPGIYGLNPTGVPGLLNVKYGSASPLPDYFVQADMIASIKRVAEANGIQSDPELVAYSNHSPFEMKASPEAITAGFYRNLTGLQGYRNTFWTGATFRAQESAKVWAFTESKLAGWVASLG